MATVPAADVSTLLPSIKTPFGEASRNRFKKNDFFFGKYRLNFLPPIQDRQCHGVASKEWTNRTLISHDQASVHILVLPGSLLSITEITEYTYFSLI